MGGVENMTEARTQLCRRFAAVAVQAEQMEARLAMGQQIDLNDHALLSSTLVRLASRLGIERTARNITPSLADYLAENRLADRRRDVERGASVARPRDGPPVKKRGPSGKAEA
jgi:hypothetical protein